jgi:hypothetical protein
VAAPLLPNHFRLHLEPAALGAWGGFTSGRALTVLELIALVKPAAAPGYPDVVRDVEEAVGAELVGRAATVAARREELLFANAHVLDVVVVDLGRGGDPRINGGTHAGVTP